MRTPWPQQFPPVLVHVPWVSTTGTCLREHPQYFAAKKRNDAKAALNICDDLCDKRTLEDVFKACAPGDGERLPLVIAPSKSLHESQNALSRAYGRWLAKEMGWATDARIFQTKTIDRDFVENGWFRLVHQPRFTGIVEKGRKYVLVDDVCTMGGTLACLRGFIENQGGTVIGMTALASHGGRDVEISLAPTTLTGVNTLLDGHFPEVFREEIGYEPACLTEPEGQFLAARCASYDVFRAGIDGARDVGT